MEIKYLEVLEMGNGELICGGKTIHLNKEQKQKFLKTVKCKKGKYIYLYV